MKKVKITVMETTFNQNLAKKYADPGLGPCTYNTPGQVFYSNGWQKPEGLCDNAWKSMVEYVMTLAHGGENFYNGWMNDKKTAMIVVMTVLGLSYTFWKLRTRMQRCLNKGHRFYIAYTIGSTS